MGLTGLAVVVLVRSVVEGHLITPLQIAGAERADGGLIELVRAVIRPLTSWATWLTFIWMAPFAVSGLRFLPKEAVYATVFGLAGAFVLAVWNDAGSNGARPF